MYVYDSSNRTRVLTFFIILCNMCDRIVDDVGFGDGTCFCLLVFFSKKAGTLQRPAGPRLTCGSGGRSTPAAARVMEQASDVRGEID